jgi:hypothetical protein
LASITALLDRSGLKVLTVAFAIAALVVAFTGTPSIFGVAAPGYGFFLRLRHDRHAE